MSRGLNVLGTKSRGPFVRGLNYPGPNVMEPFSINVNMYTNLGALFNVDPMGLLA